MISALRMRAKVPTGMGVTASSARWVFWMYAPARACSTTMPTGFSALSVMTTFRIPSFAMRGATSTVGTSCGRENTCLYTISESLGSTRA